MSEKKFDFIIIGSGSVGLALAYDLAGANKKVAVIEKKMWGGTCPNYGCDPKKMFVTAADLINEQNDLKGNGIEGRLKMDWSQIQDRKNQYVEAVKVRKISSMDRVGIKHFYGTASFINKNSISVKEGTQEVVLESNNIIISVGQKPKKLNFEGSKYLYDSEDFLNQKEIPEKSLFIGAGFIGMEFSSILNAAGKQVTVLSNGNNILKDFDSVQTDRLVSELREKNMNFIFNNTVEKIIKNNDSFDVYFSDGEIETFDKVFNTSGRNGNIEDLNLDKIGIIHDDSEINVDGFMKTNSDGIYAIGDIAKSGVPKLIPTGIFQAHYLSKLFLNNSKEEIKYTTIAQIVFSQPHLAQIGYFKEEYLDDTKYRIRDYEMDNVITFYRSNSNSRIRVIHSLEDKKIVFVSILAQEAEELINYFINAMDYNISVDKAMELIYSYPSYGSDLPLYLS